jgi:hypothetical protein
MKEKKSVEKGEDPSPSHFQLTSYDAFFALLRIIIKIGINFEMSRIIFYFISHPSSLQIHL